MGIQAMARHRKVRCDKARLGARPWTGVSESGQQAGREVSVLEVTTQASKGETSCIAWVCHPMLPLS